MRLLAVYLTRHTPAPNGQMRHIFMVGVDSVAKLELEDGAITVTDETNLVCYVPLTNVRRYDPTPRLQNYIPIPTENSLIRTVTEAETPEATGPPLKDWSLPQIPGHDKPKPKGPAPAPRKRRRKK